LTTPGILAAAMSAGDGGKGVGATAATATGAAGAALRERQASATVAARMHSARGTPKAYRIRRDLK
jgi:hypothetical protein